VTGTCFGYDVSAYQAAQNWTKHKNTDGAAFGIAKASEGMHSRDARFDLHFGGILKASLIPGAYHFGWPVQDVAAEAANYIGAVRPYATSHQVMHWLDLERYPDNRNYGSLTASEIRQWVAGWIAAVRAAFPKQRVGVYTSAADLAGGHVPAGTPLWYPAYPGTRVDTVAEARAATKPEPSGWTPVLWQFTDGPLDTSLAYKSAAELRAWVAGTTTVTYEPYPGSAFFMKGTTPALGKTSKVFTAMGKRLVAVGCGRYHIGPGPTLGQADIDSYQAWQRLYNANHKKGWSGTSLLWPPGRETWDALKIPKSS
jgi:GH25 family lysozyme M1 (1,4-beta-N-acetylmuramidase)